MADKKQGFTANALAALSDIMMRAGLAARMGKQFGGLRDLYETLGYKLQLQYDDYYVKYDRQDISRRIVDAPASATWRNVPVVKEDDDENKDTAFEEAWKTLAKKLKVWHYLERTDRLAGIGRYAVLVIGVKNSGAMDTPLELGRLKSPDDILFLATYSEKNAVINKWVTDTTNPRFGRPEQYQIDFAGDLRAEGTLGFSATPQNVHHSRVLHVADGLLEDEVMGRPRLKNVMNLLDDLAKVVGGSAEMFWRGAYKGLHADLRDGHEFADGGDADKVSAEIDEYIHGLRRFIRTKGININSLGSDVASPQYHFEAILSLIAGATGIPKRVLLGAERGELASSQDETNWNAIIHERQLHFAEPLVLRPFIDRLIELGALPEPKDPYEIEWPNLFELDEKGKAEVAEKKASVVQKLAPFDTDTVVTREEIRTMIGLDPNLPDEIQKRLDERGDDIDGDDDVDDEFRQRVQSGRSGPSNPDDGGGGD